MNKRITSVLSALLILFCLVPLWASAEAVHLPDCQCYTKQGADNLDHGLSCPLRINNLSLEQQYEVWLKLDSNERYAVMQSGNGYLTNGQWNELYSYIVEKSSQPQQPEVTEAPSAPMAPSGGGGTQLQQPLPFVEPVCLCGSPNHLSGCPIRSFYEQLVNMSDAELVRALENCSYALRAEMLALLGRTDIMSRPGVQQALKDKGIDPESGLKTVCDNENDPKVIIKGRLPEGARLAFEVLGRGENEDDYLYAVLKLQITDAYGKIWQPMPGDSVDVMLLLDSIGGIPVEDGESVRVLLEKEGVNSNQGVYNKRDGALTFSLDGVSIIRLLRPYGANSINGVIYFDLNAGDVVINGSDYCGYIFYNLEDQYEAKEISGTLKSGQSFYIFQSNDDNREDTGMKLGPDGKYHVVLPEYPRISNWERVITSNTEIDGDDGVIAMWNKLAFGSGRTATPNSVSIVDARCEVFIDNLWSSKQTSGSQRNDGGISVISAEAPVTVNLKLRGDNRFGNILYSAPAESKSQLSIGGDDNATLTVCNLANNSGANQFCSAIGGNDDPSQEDACGIVINGGIIFAGTTAADAATAIGGGANGDGSVKINGGIVTAVAYSGGTAIGGGAPGSTQGGNGEIAVTGGKTYAFNHSPSYLGSSYLPSAAIGGGSSYMGRTGSASVAVSGGMLYAQSLSGTAIGGGGNAENDGGTADIVISGGTIYAKSVSGIIGKNEAPAGLSIGGGRGGVAGNGGDCVLKISGVPEVRAGTVGGGYTVNSLGSRGAVDIGINGGSIQGQFSLVGSEAGRVSFSMRGGSIDNSAAASEGFEFLEDNGGALFLEFCDADITGTVIENCKAEYGGAIYAHNSSLKLADVSFSGCTAGENGGTVYALSSEISGSVSVSASKAIKGGALYAENSALQLRDSDFMRCRSADGAGLYIIGSETQLSGGRVTDNTASGFGGGIYVGGESSVCSLDGLAQIFRNTAKNGGGIYAAAGADISVNGADIYENKAIYVGDRAKMPLNALDEASVTGVGGGVYLASGTETNSGSVLFRGEANSVYSNLADLAADDVYASAEHTELLLPSVASMEIPGALATGWYADYAKGDTAFVERGLSDGAKGFEAADVTRYRDALSTDTSHYQVEGSLLGGTTPLKGKYVCLTVGKDVIYYGQLEISCSGEGLDGRQFVYRVSSLELDAEKLPDISFDIAVPAGSSVTVNKVPFGRYAVLQLDGWATGCACVDGAEKEVLVNSSDVPAALVFTNEKLPAESVPGAAEWRQYETASRVKPAQPELMPTAETPEKTGFMDKLSKFFEIAVEMFPGKEAGA